MSKVISALITGFRDGWEQGPELSSGMSYHDEAPQRAFDAAAWIGCGVAVLLSRGWRK